MRTAMSGLDNRNSRSPTDATRAVILIDPFSDPEELSVPDVGKLTSMIGPLISSLIQQPRFKPEDLALAGDAVNLIVSDYMVVSIARTRGLDYTWVPHSLTVGGVIVKKNGPVKTVRDLAGKTVAVSGGANDKSYLLLRVWSNGGSRFVVVTAGKRR